MKKIIFYDLETTGRSAYWDQIIQIAAICTDEHLNVLDEMNLVGKLNSFSVPDPEALLVNKIPIDSIYKSNFSNYSLITEISNNFLIKFYRIITNKYTRRPFRKFVRNFRD